MGGLCSGGDAPAPGVNTNTPRGRKEGGAQPKPAASTPGRSVTIATSARQGAGHDPNADLMSKLGTSMQDNLDAQDLIKKHLADAPDQEYLKHIIDETSENFIDVRTLPSHHEDQSERTGDYQHLLNMPVQKITLSSLPQPSTASPDVLFNVPAPPTEWLHGASHAISQAANQVAVKPINQEIVVSFKSLIAAN